MTLHADQAARWTRAAQIGAAGAGALVVLVVAGLVAFLPAPQDAVEVPEVTPAPVEAPPRPAPTAQFTHTDWKEVAPLLSWIAPDPASSAVVENGKEGPGPVPTPVDLLSWRYLGMVHERAASYALVAVDGKQRFVWEGDRVGGGEIVSITPERLAVRINGRVQEIAAARPPESGVHVPPASGARGGGTPIPGPGALSEERQAELERQLQEEAARDRARRDSERRNRPQPGPQPPQR